MCRKERKPPFYSKVTKKNNNNRLFTQDIDTEAIKILSKKEIELYNGLDIGQTMPIIYIWIAWS